MNQRVGDWLILVATFVWAAIVYAVYFVIHKPFAVTNAQRFLDIGRELGVAAALMVGAAGLGLLVIDRWRLPGITHGERLGLGLLVGLGGVGLGWLLLGLAGLLYPGVALVVVGGLALLGGVMGRRWWQAHPAPISLPPLLSLYLVVMLGLSLVRTLMPATDWDGLSYHLTVPARWIALGRVGWIGAEGPFYYPHLIEALFVPALLLGGDSAARLLHWIFYPLTLWLVGDMSQRFLPSVAPWRAVALAASLPMLAQLASWAYSDVALAAFTCGSALALLLGWQHQGEGGRGARRWWGLVGLLAGFTLGIKYQAVVIVVGVLLWAAWQTRQVGLIGQQVGVVGGVALMLWAPWLLRNIWLTGDPFYPFGSIGRGWDTFRTTAFAAAGTGIGLDVGAVLALPWSLTMGLNGIVVYDGLVGPLFLTLLPLALWFVVRRGGTAEERRVVVGLLLMALPAYGFWVVGVMNSQATSQTRFLLPVFILLSPVVAWGWGALGVLTTERLQPMGLVNLLVGVALCFAGVRALVDSAVEISPGVLVGFGSQDEANPVAAYLAQRQGALWAATVAANALPPERKLLLLWEPRSYYLRQPVDPDIILDEFAHRLWLAQGDIDQVVADMRAEGITHLLIYWRGVELLIENQDVAMTPQVQTALQSLVADRAYQLWQAEDRSYALYELVDKRSMQPWSAPGVVQAQAYADRWRSQQIAILDHEGAR